MFFGFPRSAEANRKPARLRAMTRLSLLAALVLTLVSCEEPGDDRDDLSCGEGTIDEDGECVPDNCGDGTAMLGSECVALDLQYVSIPLAAGEEAWFGQTFHGNLSHHGSSRYAVDLGMPEGTTIVAARDGRVLQIKEDSDTGCGDPSCAPDGNFVLLDHGDGTLSEYYHLQLGGALVDVGDTVCAGDPIGLSGNTGFSTGPHLHFTVHSPIGQTLPLRFLELLEVSGGVPAPGMVVESSNSQLEACDVELDWSECGEDLFLHQGVWLDPGVPCAVAELDRPYPISGTTTAGETVVFATWGPDAITGEEQWRYQCNYVDEDGGWSWDLLFATETSFSTSWLMIFAGDAECYHQGGGWSSSVPLELHEP